MLGFLFTDSVPFYALGRHPCCVARRREAPRTIYGIGVRFKDGHDPSFRATHRRKVGPEGFLLEELFVHRYGTGTGWRVARSEGEFRLEEAR